MISRRAFLAGVALSALIRPAEAALGFISGKLPAAAGNEAETTTYLGHLASTPTARRQLTINRLVKKLKDGGVYARLSHAWLLNSDVQANSLIDLIGTQNASISAGAPVFTANAGWTGTTADYLDTGWNPSTAAIDVTDFSFSVWSETSSSSASSDLGLFDGTNGITIDTNNSGSVTFRANGALRTSTAFSSTNDGSGMYTVSVKSGQAALYRNGVFIEQVAYTTAAAVNLSLYLLKINGASSSSGRRLGFFAVGSSMTAEQVRNLFAAFCTYREVTSSGDLLFYDPGVQPPIVVADVIIAGATAQGVVAAREIARQGHSVAIVGSQFERHLGGMSSGGLGAIDIDNTGAIGGLCRLIFTRINQLNGAGDTVGTFQPRHFERIMRSFCDPSRADGADIPIYWSDGFLAVGKNSVNGRVGALKTRDGRVFAGTVFLDATYEGDLCYLAGCTMTLGREAAGSGTEAVNGYRGVTTLSGGGNFQFRHISSNTYYNIDPYRTAGVSSSGLLPFVVADPAGSAGAADASVQSMNFRPTVTNGVNRVAFDKPAGYTLKNYEATFRFLAALTADSKVDPTDFSTTTNELWARRGAGSVYDINAGGGQSTDLWGFGAAYILGGADTRASIRRLHQDWIRGYLYTLANGRTAEGDTRMPAAVESDFGAYGYDRLHYTDPYPGDPLWFPYSLYVREGRRLVGSYVHDGNDITGTDGTTPRSIKTIAVASYQMDSHHHQQIADLSGTPRLWNIGGFEVTTNGDVDKMSPIPYEALLPKRSDATNLLMIGYGMSGTHVAIASMRMELTGMCSAQAAGIASSIMIETGVDAQDVPYLALRTRLLASPTLSGEVAPVLPQVN